MKLLNYQTLIRQSKYTCSNHVHRFLRYSVLYMHLNIPLNLINIQNKHNDLNYFINFTGISCQMTCQHITSIISSERELSYQRLAPSISLWMEDIFSKEVSNLPKFNQCIFSRYILKFWVFQSIILSCQNRQIIRLNKIIHVLNISN